MTDAERILGEFIDAWKAGERPDPDAYLHRVPAPQREELAAGIDRWLLLAPTPVFTPAARAAITAEPALRAALQAARAPESLTALRARAGLSIGDLAARVAARFGLAETERTAGYLERVERGDLDPGRLSWRLLDALADLLGASVAPPPAAPAQAFFRADEEADEWIAQDIDALSRAALAAAPAPMDELDRLFLGGPDA